jgi:nucleotide-binding universal stress UspA family protein
MDAVETSRRQLMSTQALESSPRMPGATYARILVPVDGSPRAEAILPHAIAMAKRFGSTVELARSYSPSPGLVTASAASSLPGTGPVLDTGSYVVAGREEAEVYLQELEARVRAQGVEVEHRRLDGTPGEAIAEESRRADVDLIAMTTHGRGGLGRLVLGSVADYVVHHAACPVLLVRAA